MPMSRRVEWLPMLALCLVGVAHADDPAPATPSLPPPPAASAGASARERLALLEFLGSFVSAAGDWVDPFSLDDAVFEKVSSEKKGPGDE